MEWNGLFFIFFPIKFDLGLKILKLKILGSRAGYSMASKQKKLENNGACSSWV